MSYLNIYNEKQALVLKPQPESKPKRKIRSIPNEISDYVTREAAEDKSEKKDPIFNLQQVRQSRTKMLTDVQQLQARI